MIGKVDIVCDILPQNTHRRCVIYSPDHFHHFHSNNMGYGQCGYK